MRTVPSKHLFPVLRRLSDGAFHSGEAIAACLGLSRASVFNAISDARQLGYAIHAVRGHGYRLPNPPEWLDEVAIRQALGTHAASFALDLRDCVDSTNRLAYAAALQGDADGLVVAAEYQSAGRGRRGRQWLAGPGESLLFSRLCRFECGPDGLSGLSLVAGLAVVRALARANRVEATLKWPNDVLVGGRKLAGILIEVQGDAHGPAFAVIGVGINLRLPRDLRQEIDQAVVDLDELGAGTGRNRLLAACLLELSDAVAVFRQSGFAAFRAAWQAHDAYAGRRVRLQGPDGRSVTGVSAGVNANGAYLLREASGDVQAFNGGELSLRLDGAAR